MDFFNGIVWGEAGSGKTPFCGTLEAYEKTTPCLFLDVDHGTLSLNGTKPCPAVYPIDNWADVQVVYGHLKNRRWVDLGKLVGEQGYNSVGNPKEYKSVVIDSGTDLANNLLRTIVGEDDRNEGVADQAAYQRVQIRFGQLWRSFIKLSLSVVMTAGVKDMKDDISGLVRVYPEFSPGLLHDLQRHSDLILFMNVALESEGTTRKWVRYIQTQPTQRFVARDRSGRLDPVIKGDKLYWGDMLKKVLV